MALKPTRLVVTPLAYAKAASPAAGGLTRCSASLHRLLGRPVPESGTLRHGDGAHGRATPLPEC